MGSFLTNHTLLITLIFLSIFFLLATGGLLTETNPNFGTEKLSHLHFYLHDIVSGKHPSSVRVAGPKNKFGMTAVVDDPLTVGVEPGSKVVGRAQGIYSVSSEDGGALLMVMNLEFVEAKYNGSSVSLLGRNSFMETVREMPIVGGSGLFRFARGYALANTHRFNVATGDAVVEYNVYVMHY